jgi:hypothetical protein
MWAVAGEERYVEDQSGLWLPPAAGRSTTRGESNPTSPPIGDGIARYATIVVTAATGVGYLIGIWCVQLFSDRLGVAPSDLGIETADYLSYWPH